MNEIGALNELWQKKHGNQPGPVYTVTRSGGPDHLPTFLCTVYFAGKISKGNPCTTSKDAKRSAALAWLNTWQHYAQPAQYSCPDVDALPLPSHLHEGAALDEARTNTKIPDNVVIYLDLENKPKELPLLLDAGCSNIRVYAAAKWPALPKYKQDYGENERITFCEVDSGETNAADVALIVDVSQAIAQNPEQQAVVISGDGIFYALRDVFRGFARFRHHIYAKTFLEEYS